jgi:hypothetical protein
LVLLSLTIILTYFIFKKNILFKKFFLLVGVIINILMWTIIFITFGAFKHFDASLLRVVYTLIGAGIIGWITALFLRPLLFPVKLVDPSTQI